MYPHIHIQTYISPPLADLGTSESLPQPRSSLQPKRRRCTLHACHASGPPSRAAAGARLGLVGRPRWTGSLVVRWRRGRVARPGNLLWGRAAVEPSGVSRGGGAHGTYIYMYIYLYIYVCVYIYIDRYTYI